MAKYNADNVRYFVLSENLAANGGHVVFRTYTDHANAFGKGSGKGVMYTEGLDEDGKPRGKWFRMDQSRRRFSVRLDQIDVNGISMYDFLRYSPACEGSPNLPEGGIPQFKELNEEKDAELALEADEKRIKAAASVLEIDEATLGEIGTTIGQFGNPDKIMRLHVLEWAQKNPYEYFKALEAPDRQIRALIRKGVAEEVLEKKGDIIYYGNTVLGNNETAATAVLLGDTVMRDALAEKVQFKIVEQPKKRGPKPKQ